MKFELRTVKFWGRLRIPNKRSKKTWLVASYKWKHEALAKQRKGEAVTEFKGHYFPREAKRK